MAESSLSTVQHPVVIPHLLDPQENTIILLHGRGWTASRFSEFLLSIPVRDGKTLQDLLPRSKFIFPQAPRSRATKYKRSVISQWYDGSGDWEPEALGGMRAGLEYVLDLLAEEIEWWKADAGRVVLMGHSQGCAMAMISLLLRGSPNLGAVVGTCGFIPLNQHMQGILDAANGLPKPDDDIAVFEEEDTDDPGASSVQKALDALKEETEVGPPHSIITQPAVDTPVLLLHGTEDDEVAIIHGRQTSALLQKFGFTNVHFHEFDRAGHTITPGMLSKTVEFLYQNRHCSSL